MYPRWILDNKYNYEYILKNHREYSTNESIWEKSYCCCSSVNDDGLNALKRRYSLDRIKNGKSDLEICFKAMEWTFLQLLNNTHKEYTGSLNAADILQHCRDTHTTVNCLCHATVLTEILLALGYLARKVSCLPIDVVPYDNHVVTIVYVPSLKKWIMLDPSLCCFITDSNDNVLSLSEIREYLINEKKIKVCTYSRFANLNMRNKETDSFSEEYIAYWYKNIFRFISRRDQNSATTKEGDVFYMLVPKGYLPANQVQSLFVESANVEVRITDNEVFFWHESIKEK